MNLIALALLLNVAAAAPAADPKTTAEAAVATSQHPDTSAMVEAAKQSKRKASTTKVITNADLKKSKAKVTQLTEKDQKAVLITPASSGPSTIEKQDAELKAEAATKVRIASAEKEIAELERDLILIERNYFEESDLDRRDKLITKQFADTKAKLAAARAALAALTGSHE